jgi:oligosaccharide repeat unit polymerase
MYRTTLDGILYTALAALVVLLIGQLVSDSAIFVVGSCSVCVLLYISLYKFDYLSPAAAYLFPWLLILVFSIIPISSHARPIDGTTYALLLANIFAWLFGCIAVPIRIDNGKTAPRPPFENALELRSNFGTMVTASFVVLYMFAVVNIFLAGYIPFVSLITTGDSRYWEFGIPSVYGAFLAYANALGCVAFYIFLRTHRRAYLFLFLSVLAIHFAFVTRQNMATLLMEAFVIRSIVVKPFSRVTLLWSVVLALGVFSALGTLRSGDIKTIIAVQPQFDWIPTSLIWVYAYSYFNALNIDNTIAYSGAPFFDGYMWQTLLPSVLRPDVDHGTFLELASMNVSSYVYPVFIDIGKGVIFWTLILGFLTAYAYRRAQTLRRFVDISIYSCLLFCAFLSFFTDFWLYLPVIFQIFFFAVFQSLLFKSSSPRFQLSQST